MLEMNKVMLIGNLTRDPESSQIASGTPLAKMGLAVNRKFKGKSGDSQEEVAFIDVTAWGKTAEFCSQWLKKGTRIYVEGRLTFSQWEKDGVKRSKIDVTADRIQFALPKSASEQSNPTPRPSPSPGQSPPSHSQTPPGVDPSDNLPF